MADNRSGISFRVLVKNKYQICSRKHILKNPAQPERTTLMSIELIIFILFLVLVFVIVFARRHAGKPQNEPTPSFVMKMFRAPPKDIALAAKNSQVNHDFEYTLDLSYPPKADGLANLAVPVKRRSNL